MRIAQVTISTPYKENLRGTTGIQYHLLVKRPKDVEVTTYTFNANKLSDEQITMVEHELNINIKVIRLPIWLEWFMNHPVVLIRLLLKYPFSAYYRLPKSVVQDIRDGGYDGVWLYGQELFRMLNEFDGLPRVHTLPDSESLFCYRMLGYRYINRNVKSLWWHMVMYPKFLRMERDMPRGENIHYTLVGQADAEFLKNNNLGIHVHFLLHPHYEIPTPEKIINFGFPKIRLLLAGQYNMYMSQDADEWLDAMCKVNDLQEHYEITILGKNWERFVERLRDAGYSVNYIRFAPDYIEEIRRHDVQFTPISIGTGTKGKVLDALANGLLVIGTHYALENISVVDGVSCIMYSGAENAISVLRDVANTPKKYEQMAEIGRKSVLKAHARDLASERLFGLIRV